MHGPPPRAPAPFPADHGDTAALRRGLVAAIACFVAAAGAGTVLRLGLAHGLPFGLQHGDVRLAHTHLMYFGWVTPALFALIGDVLRRRSDRPLPRLFHAAIAASLIAGVLAFGPFASDGYQPSTILGMRLPLSMIASSLAVLAWYAWALAYALASARLHRDLALLALDAALLALLVATTGAWGLALAAFAPLASGALMDALVRFYLDTFSNGWFAIAVVGLMAAAHARRVDETLGRLALGALLTGTLGAALVRLGEGPAWLEHVLRLGAAYGLLLLAITLGLAALHERRHTHLVLVALLAAKALADGALAFDAVALRVDGLLLGVVLTHAYLLGLVTLAIVAMALERFGGRDAPFWLLTAAIATMLLLQLPLTLAWPLGRGAWVLHAATWSTLAPTATMLVVAARLLRPGAAAGRAAT